MVNSSKWKLLSNVYSEYIRICCHRIVHCIFGQRCLKKLEILRIFSSFPTKPNSKTHKLILCGNILIILIFFKKIRSALRCYFDTLLMPPFLYIFMMTR